MKRALSRKNAWNALPSPLRAVAGRIAGMLPLPWLLGGTFRRWYRFLNDAQWWDAERLREYQTVRVRQLLSLAYERTSYYRQAFEAVGFRPEDFKDLSDLSALPTIDKATIREHLEEMHTRSVNSAGVDYVSTGGTSGTPLSFYIGAERSGFEFAHLLRTWERVGYTGNTPMAVFRGRQIKERSIGLRYEYDPMLRHHYYSNFHMTDDAIGQYVDHIRGIGRCFLHAYPSSAHLLADYLLRHRLPGPPNIKGVIVESECVYPDQRRVIEQVFGARLFSCYGHSEKLVLAGECEYSTDYHVWPTYGYCELLDEKGERITRIGDVGEIVGTGFVNTIVPFIRYRTGDFAVLGGDGCSQCERSHMLLRSVEGRWPRGALVANDGSLISMTALNVHDDTFDAIRQYQFYQVTPGQATLRVVPVRSLDMAEGEHIARRLMLKLGNRIRLDIQVVDQIALTARGKFLLVDQRIAGIVDHVLARTTGR